MNRTSHLSRIPPAPEDPPQACPTLPHDLEIEAVPPLVVAEESSKARVRYVVMDSQRIEAIRQVRARHRQPDHVLLANLEIAYQPRVGGKEVVEACSVAVRMCTQESTRFCASLDATLAVNSA